MLTAADFNAQIPIAVDTINTLNYSQLCLLATCIVNIKYLIIEQRVKGDSGKAEHSRSLSHLEISARKLI